jgi:hypothetical protein|tara:strand:- start:39 stop:647 length:609 start_codon:yes stop_codon:yes gene_type:complete
MSEQLTQRLNQILPKIMSDEFLAGSGIGNEIAFHIFDYPPEYELEVRRHLDTLLQHLQRSKPNLRVKHINLFDFLIEYLEERGLLEESLKLQREQGDAALARALKGVLSEDKIARRFGNLAQPAEHDLLLISGVGSVYPLLRSHTLLNNLHSIMGQTPLVMFYPGKYDQTSLRLFGKRSTSGGGAASRGRQVNYYRAFRLID